MTPRAEQKAFAWMRMGIDTWEMCSEDAPGAFPVYRRAATTQAGGKQMTDKMQIQRAEFDAVAKLAEQYRRITMTPVVDDDYPEVRHDYEGALAGVLRAMKDNGRFEQGNRYGLAAPHPAQPQEREPSKK